MTTYLCCGWLNGYSAIICLGDKLPIHLSSFTPFRKKTTEKDFVFIGDTDIWHFSCQIIMIFKRVRNGIYFYFDNFLLCKAPTVFYITITYFVWICTWSGIWKHAQFQLYISFFFNICIIVLMLKWRTVFSFLKVVVFHPCMASVYSSHPTAILSLYALL